MSRASRASLVILLAVLSFPLPALAAQAEHGGWGIWETIGRVFNLALLLGALIYLLRRPLREYFEQRTDEIRKRLREAEQARDEANAKLDEIGSRMARLDAELAEIQQTAAREAEEERQRVVESARSDAEKIVSMARREIDGLMKSARLELKCHTADLSVNLAEEVIRREMRPEDRERIFQGFLEELEKKG
ncbi:MAG: ATP synthase F0 subunit B [Acidobacteria bacterium]|nr:ATP synthase F0 subunit B [Acidobacteriota bacterium]